MKLRLISDVHVNFYNSSKPLIEILDSLFPEIDSNNEILIIAGDVGEAFKGKEMVEKYIEMLKYFSKRWKHIVYVPGNHEFYYLEIPYNEANDRISNLCEKLGIQYLNKDIVELFGYTFVGCTLWSNVNKEWFDTAMKERYSPGINHTKFIELHKSHVEWMDLTLSKCPDKKVIVITHFLPLKKLISGKFSQPMYKISNTGYYTDLDWIFKKHHNCIAYWFCGHSHITELVKYENTIVYLNPLGNPKDLHLTKVFQDTLPMNGIKFTL